MKQAGISMAKPTLLSFCLVLFPACGDAITRHSSQPGEEASEAITVNPDAPSARHAIAGRSALPEIGETFEQPIPTQRLSDEEQFVRAIDPADIPAIVPWDEASRYVGYEITVQGRVVNVGQSRDGKVNFLNFHQDYRGKFYMVLFDDLAKTLETPVADLFKSKLVRVKGNVQTYRGKPQIRITSMDQVVFVDE